MTHEPITETEEEPDWLREATTEEEPVEERTLRTVAADYRSEKNKKNPETAARYHREITRFFDWYVNLPGKSEATLDTIGRRQVSAYLTYLRAPHYAKHPGDCTTDCVQLKKGGYAVSSLKRRLASISGFYRYAVRIGRLDRNPAEQFELGKSNQGEDTLHPAELAALYDAALNTYARILPARIAMNYRNAALVALIGGTGLRREEAVSLRIENMGRDLAGRPTISFTRKGGDPATLPISLFVHQAVMAAVGDRASGPILIGYSNRKGKTQQISLDVVNDIITELGIRTGIRGADLYPHLFRKTAITLALTLPETSPEDVRKYHGHKNFKTTDGYDALRSMLFKDIAENPLQPRTFWKGQDKLTQESLDLAG